MFSYLGKLAGSGIKESLDGVGGLAKDLRQAFTGEVPPEIGLKLNEIDAKIAQGQQEITLQEAKSGSLFIAGWRPFLGWVCGIGVAIHIIVNPIMIWICTLLGYEAIIITLEIATVISLLTTLLGVGGLRTLEKFKGVNDKH